MEGNSDVLPERCRPHDPCGRDLERNTMTTAERQRIQYRKDHFSDMDDNLVLLNYKEPLKKVTDGHGFYGAITVTKDGKGVQCHICGLLFSSVKDHIRHAHNISVPQYKEQFQLSDTSALISEELRQRFIDSSNTWYASLSPKEKEALREKRRRGIIAYLKKHPEGFAHGKSLRLEARNKRGTCPDQLLEKIRGIKEKLGHTPSKEEFIRETKTQRFVHIIYKTFGSWSTAVRMSGMDAKEKHNASKGKHYTRDQLLDYLKIYYQENNRPPSASDCRRSLIPSLESYINRFGSFHNARLAAGITERPTRWGTR